MKFFVLLLSFFLTFWSVFATETTSTWETISPSIQYEINVKQDIESEIKEAISINTNYTINLSWLEEKLKILYPDATFEATWDVLGASSQQGFSFERMFREKWTKEITLNIYKSTSRENAEWVEEINSEIFYSKQIQLLVYEKSILLILSENVESSEIENYVQFAKNDGTYIFQVGPLSKTDIELNSIITSIDNYSKTSGLRSDYVTIWWERDFIFDILSKLNRETQSNKDLFKNKLNIVGISSYNIEVMQNYLWNFLTKKDWIESLLLTNEETKYLIFRNNQIADFKKDLEENERIFVDVSLTNEGINQIFFISNFINNLSNLGYTTDNIYIFLILPAILAGISFFKHFVGFSPIGVVIPLFLTLLFFKLGFLPTLILTLLFILINLWISVIIERYNLLYTPKISFVLTLNIIFFIIVFNLFSYYNIFPLDLSDILYFIVFIIISEKFINIIISKDLLEYKTPFIYTLVIASLCYFILNIDAIKLLTLAYPELILGLIPLNFLLWRFTWLRITEYFRFKEIIKSVEEE